MRDAAIAIIREIGVDTGGSNIQFAVHPENGRLVVIEMNPRVSRSSALATKATGFPIAKIAAKLAVGYTLDEIPNDITRETPACFEPTIDYVVTKIPRFTFEKFPQARDVLGPQMKSVGEAMAIGRTFKESLQKALRSLEIDSRRLRRQGPRPASRRRELRGAACACRTRDRLWYVGDAFRRGHDAPSEIVDAVDDRSLVPRDTSTRSSPTSDARGRQPRRRAERLRRAQGRWASPTCASAQLLGRERGRGARSARQRAGIAPVYKTVDTCGAEFVAYTPYLYSTYEDEDESGVTDAQEDHDPRRRPEPHRPGHRVRLLLRARRLRAQGGRLRDHHGQLQPGDGVHRLRHLGQALLRAAHARGRARDRRARAARRRDRAVRRPDAAQARRAARARRRADHRHLARLDRPRRGPRALRRAARRSSACASRRNGIARSSRRGDRASRRASATRCWCGRPTCSAAAPWRSSTTSDEPARATCDRAVAVVAGAPGARSTSSSRTRSRSTSTPSATATTS